MSNSIRNYILRAVQLLPCAAIAVISLTAESAFALEPAWFTGTPDISYGNPGPEVLGTPGVPDAANSPGSLTNAATWDDSDGNLWMFSGYQAGGSFHARLWKFDTDLLQWINYGYTSREPVYGELGVESSSAHPGARGAAMVWEDHQGHTWMYGGFGIAENGGGYLSDLWRFNPTTEMWTWMGGSKNRNVDGVTSTSQNTTPGQRSNGVTWVDSSGDLWLFGGIYGYVSPGYEGWINPPFNLHYLNDLWRFDVESLQWHLVQQDTGIKQSTGNHIVGPYFGSLGTYGNLGQSSDANRPGSRIKAVSWTDKLGNFWLFGGEGYSSVASVTHPRALNDLWKFQPGTGKWTWVGGSNLSLQSDFNPAPPDTFDPANSPGARVAATGWIEGNKLLLYGGETGPSSFGETKQTIRNAVWTYDIASNTWAWTSNSPQLSNLGSYGPKGVQSDTNWPGMRSQTMAWSTDDGELWLFGGDGYAEQSEATLDDLWLIKSIQRPATAGGWELYE